MSVWDDERAVGPRGPLAWLGASFRLGRILGVEVRVFALTLVILPLIGLLELGRLSLPAAERLTDVVLMSVLLYVVVLTHELGHVLAARRYGVWTPRITLSPLGGLAHLSSPVPGPRADLVVSLAGPATHLLWMLPVWPLTELVQPGWLRPQGWAWGPPYQAVQVLWHVNLGLLVFNLLPFFPLDGGRVVRALLALRMAPARATLLSARLGQLGALGFVGVGLFRDDLWATILVVIGLSGFLACVQEIRAARHHAGPYDAPPRAPWEDDPEGWRRASAVARPGLLARARSRRRERAAARQRAVQEALARDLDRVLERVSEVGMTGLTKEERGILECAARARRRP